MVRTVRPDSLMALGILDKSDEMTVIWATSMAMSLPISTPPNAIAHSTGLVKQNEMVKIGLTIGVIGMSLGYLMLYILGINHIL